MEFSTPYWGLRNHRKTIDVATSGTTLGRYMMVRYVACPHTFMFSNSASRIAARVPTPTTPMV